MKKFTRVISMFLLVALFCGMSANAVSADGLIQDTITVPTGLNNLTVRQIVTTYFSQREAYLSGNADDIPSAVDAMVTDEAKHKTAISNAGGVFVDSIITMGDIEIWDNIALIDVTETVTININGETVAENVPHEVRVYMHDDGTLVIGRDEYLVSCVNFESCSYVPEEVEQAAEQMASGSKLCLVYVAEEEVGYTENATTGNTKYHTYYGLDASYDWCAAFVSWCVAHASIPSSVIPQSTGTRVITDFFHDDNRFLYSPATGGSTAPQAGDLIFIGGEVESVDHIGIVTSFSGSYVYYIDGNNGGKVKSSTIRYTSSDLMGFGRPLYQSSTHSYVYNEVTAEYVCSACGSVSSMVITPEAKDEESDK